MAVYSSVDWYPVSKMAALSKEEYLKRYLSNSDESGVKKKRKKKPKASAKHAKSLIIDDDVNLRDIRAKSGDENDKDDALLEENPLIFDETGTTVLSKDLEAIKEKEEARKAMWAPVKSLSDEENTENNPENVESTSSRRHDSSDRGLGKIPVHHRERHDSISPERTQQSMRTSSPDMSPPRRSDSIRGGPSDKSELSSRRRRDSPPNLSPPLRKGRTDLSPDLSPQRRGRFRKGGPSEQTTRHDTPDKSPPRRKGRTASPNLSPGRGGDPVRQRTRHDTPDQSPPRRKGRTLPASSDLSPPRQRRGVEPAKQRTRHDTPDQSPPRGKGRTASPDLSPPRQWRGGEPIEGRTRHDTPDQSPPRRKGRTISPDLSRRQRTLHDSPDQSPPRRKRTRDQSMSPKGWRVTPDLSPERKQSKKHERKAGLHSAAELKRENELSKRREDKMFSKMATTSTGKGAETVYRDREGKKRDLKIEKAMKKEEERKKTEEDEMFMEWGKGLQQTKNARNKVDDDVYEMSKPLARYQDDKDLEQMLREKGRSGDPMLAFMQKKKVQQDVLSGKKEKPRYKGPAPPPNRFNIHPGYRWDGVDRSNGFEKKRFTMLANKGATREEAYKWSVEDM